MLIRVVKKPTLADITKIHTAVSLDETMDAFTSKDTGVNAISVKQVFTNSQIQGKGDSWHG